MSLFGNIRNFFIAKKQKVNNDSPDSSVLYTPDNMSSENHQKNNEGPEENNQWNSDPTYDTGVDSSGIGSDSGGGDSGGGDGGGSSD